MRRLSATGRKSIIRAQKERWNKFREGKLNGKYVTKTTKKTGTSNTYFQKGLEVGYVYRTVETLIDDATASSGCELSGQELGGWVGALLHAKARGEVLGSVSTLRDVRKKTSKRSKAVEPVAMGSVTSVYKTSNKKQLRKKYVHWTQRPENRTRMLKQVAKLRKLKQLKAA